jgi:hypothetical protein
MPTTAIEMREEGVRSLFRLCVLSIKRLGKDADFATRHIWRTRLGGHVKAVLRREEHGAGGKHNCGVVENPIMVKGNQVVYSLSHERVSFFRKHKVIRDAHGYGTRKNDGKDKEGIQMTQAANVEVDVDAAVMMEDKVANCICPLDRIWVRIKRVEEPTIVLRNKFTRTSVSP